MSGFGENRWSPGMKTSDILSRQQSEKTQKAMEERINRRNEEDKHKRENLRTCAKLYKDRAERIQQELPSIKRTFEHYKETILSKQKEVRDLLFLKRNIKRVIMILSYIKDNYNRIAAVPSDLGKRKAINNAFYEMLGIEYHPLYDFTLRYMESNDINPLNFSDVMNYLKVIDYQQEIKSDLEALIKSQCQLILDEEKKVYNTKNEIFTIMKNMRSLFDQKMKEMPSTYAGIQRLYKDACDIYGIEHIIGLEDKRHRILHIGSSYLGGRMSSGELPHEAHDFRLFKLFDPSSNSYKMISEDMSTEDIAQISDENWKTFRKDFAFILDRLSFIDLSIIRVYDAIS